MIHQSQTSLTKISPDRLSLTGATTLRVARDETLRLRQAFRTVLRSGA